MPESSRRTVGGGRWAIALIACSLAISLFVTLPLRCDDSHALVGGMALSGGRLELLRFFHEPHEFPVVAATSSCREMAFALSARAPRQTLPLSALLPYASALSVQPVRIAELPPARGDAGAWLAELREQGVTHVVVFKDLPSGSPPADLQAATAAAISALPDKFGLIWDGRWVEVYEIVR